MVIEYDTSEKPIFVCSICDIKTHNKKDYKRHLMTVKHGKMVENGMNMVDECVSNADDNLCINKKSPDVKCFECSCGRKYLYSSGLYRHRKTCAKKSQHDEQSDVKEVVMSSERQQVFMALLKDNKEFKQLIIEQLAAQTAAQSEFNKNQIENNTKILECIKECNVVNNNTMNNITNNNTFNMQVFLNEKCANELKVGR